MKAQNAKTLIAAVTGLGAVFGAGVVATPASAQGRPPMRRYEPREQHPAIRAALRNLMAARANLQHGAHDFNGHRARALELTNQAIAEAQLALRSDRR